MTWVLTHSGQKVDLLDPDPATIRLEDVAWHLAHINRFAGGTPWSVAAHSILTVRLACDSNLTPYQRLWLLMHDAHETYTGDIPCPMKELIGKDRVRDIELGLDKAIRIASGISHLHSASVERIVKKFDNAARSIERTLFLPDHKEWPKTEISPMFLVEISEVLDRTPEEWAEKFGLAYMELLNRALDHQAPRAMQ